MGFKPCERLWPIQFVSNPSLTMIHLLNATADLDQAQLERKIRLLSLTTLAFQNIGRDLPYSAIAETLQVDPTEVERWVIDGA